MWDVGTMTGVVAATLAAPAAWFAWKATANDRRSASEHEWIDHRALLNSSRDHLSATAREMHTGSGTVTTVEDTDMLMLPEWRKKPILLDDVRVIWRPTPAADQKNLLRESSKWLPPTRKGGRYPRYSEAMRALAKPRLFEDRLSYRLVGLTWRDDADPVMEFATCRYFDMLDVSEPLAHELARVKGRGWPTFARKALPSWRQLPLRSRFKQDVLGLETRAVLPSIGTLLLRRAPDGEATFLLHRRDPNAVAIAGGHYSLIPAGVFQPCSDSPVSLSRDLDLWRSIARELDEELLGSEEARGEGGVPIDYELKEPYASFQREIAEGRMTPWCLGLGIDPLTLTVELLTCLVVDADAYDKLFATAVMTNEEGHLVAAGHNTAGLMGFDFSHATFEELRTAGQLSPVATATAALALKHRELLLGARLPHRSCQGSVE